MNERCVTEERPFFSPYTQGLPYWIVLEGLDAAEAQRQGVPTLHNKPGLYGFAAGTNWAERWAKLGAVASAVGLRAAIIAAGDTPSLQEIELSLRAAVEIDAVAKNLWLVHYVHDGRLICFMQRILDRRHKQVGHEAFARIEGPDGKLLSGGVIMQAARALHMEYQLDRMMHRHAVDCFVESDFDGFLFINFLTGFIQRPEVYLDGLNHAVERNRLLPRSIALDVPLVDYAKDITKLKSIAQYCHARGFALSLDDVMSPEGLAPLLQDIRPAFVKLDAKLATGMKEPKGQGMIREIIRLAHAAGASVVAEGVEDEALHAAYQAADVDLFQGYLFGVPERCPPLAKAS